MTRFSRILVVSLYRHCIDTHEEFLLLSLFDKLIELLPEANISFQFPEFFLELFNAYVR